MWYTKMKVVMLTQKYIRSITLENLLPLKPTELIELMCRIRNHYCFCKGMF